MPVYVPDPVSEKGKADAKRHRDKQREVLKKNLPQIIAEESIITSKKGKIVKIPIRSIDIPHFRPKKGEGGEGGIGQGPGKKGDVIGRKRGSGRQPGDKAGNEPGEEWIETEVELEELIELMLEDMGLPELKEKDVRQIIVETGLKIKGLSKAGPWVLLDKRRTAWEGMRRFWFLLRALMQEAGKSELICFSALKKAKGVMPDALEYLRDPNFIATETEVVAFPIFGSDDTRFRRVENDISEKSRAVVIAMLDVSGSMSTIKKYLARSMLFWFTAFLRQLYTEVDIRFVIHHTLAKIVDEDAFFNTGESGGTFCYAAYELANALIDTEYPVSSWNVYVVHLSDGDDFDGDRTCEELDKLFAKNINMVGYVEVKPVEYMLFDSGLMAKFKQKYPILSVDSNGLNMAIGKKNFPFFGVVIKKKEDVWPALKELLKKDRWANE